MSSPLEQAREALEMAASYIRHFAPSSVSPEVKIKQALAALDAEPEAAAPSSDLALDLLHARASITYLTQMLENEKAKPAASPPPPAEDLAGLADTLERRMAKAKRVTKQESWSTATLNEEDIERYVALLRAHRCAFDKIRAASPPPPAEDLEDGDADAWKNAAHYWQREAKRLQMQAEAPSAGKRKRITPKEARAIADKARTDADALRQADREREAEAADYRCAPALSGKDRETLEQSAAMWDTHASAFGDGQEIYRKRAARLRSIAGASQEEGE